MSVCLFVCLSVCLSVCLPPSLPTYLSIIYRQQLVAWSLLSRSIILSDIPLSHQYCQSCLGSPVVGYHTINLYYGFRHFCHSIKHNLPTSFLLFCLVYIIFASYLPWWSLSLRFRSWLYMNLLSLESHSIYIYFCTMFSCSFLEQSLILRNVIWWAMSFKCPLWNHISTSI